MRISLVQKGPRLASHICQLHLIDSSVGTFVPQSPLGRLAAHHLPSRFVVRHPSQPIPPSVDVKGQEPHNKPYRTGTCAWALKTACMGIEHPKGLGKCVAQ